MLEKNLINDIFIISYYKKIRSISQCVTKKCLGKIHENNATFTKSRIKSTIVS